MLTQERLKELLHYNPETGVFTWVVNRTGKAHAGSQAGSYDSYGYLRVSVDAKSYKIHHLPFLYMTGSLPKSQVDHINHLRDDNTWVNLREATIQQNSTNTRKRGGTSIFKGVSWTKGRANKWIAGIKAFGKPYHLGYFTNELDAAITYNKAAIKHFGEFAHLNELQPNQPLYL